MKRKTVLIIVLILVIITAGFIASSFYLRNNTAEPDFDKTACLKISDSAASCDFNLELAATASQRTKGLSGRQSLSPKTGMLFVFDETSEQCIWMKDMRFSIDIVWLNESKEIIKIEDTVAPETYPNSFCAPYTKYVIELNKGEAKSVNLTSGQQLKF